MVCVRVFVSIPYKQACKAIVHRVRCAGAVRVRERWEGRGKEGEGGRGRHSHPMQTQTGWIKNIPSFFGSGPVIRYEQDRRRGERVAIAEEA